MCHYDTGYYFTNLFYHIYTNEQIEFEILPLKNPEHLFSQVLRIYVHLQYFYYIEVSAASMNLSSFQQCHRQIIHISACWACHDKPADGFQRVV